MYPVEMLLRDPKFRAIPGPAFDADLARNSITAISISRRLRFGNSVRQVCNAITLALHYHIKRVYLPGYSWLKPGSHDFIGGIELVNAPNVVYSDDELLLYGDFFQVYRIIPHKEAPNPHSILRHLGGEISYSLNGAPLPPCNLVIHLRAGDIFKDAVAPGYGQPPLAFYSAIINSSDWSKIWIVAEDDGNPILGDLLSLSNMRSECCALIHRPVDDDIDFLLSARNLVASNGTFCRAVSALSANLETVFSFERSYKSWGNPNVKVVEWRDLKGDYKNNNLSDNWLNTPQQREMMIKYPVENIGLRSQKPSRM